MQTEIPGPIQATLKPLPPKQAAPPPDLSAPVRKCGNRYGLGIMN
jgi:hypothetical protein